MMCNQTVWVVHGTRGQYDSMEYWTAAVCASRAVAFAEARRLLEEEIKETFKRGRDGYQAVLERMPEFLDRAWNPSPLDEDRAIARIEVFDDGVGVNEENDPPWQYGTEFAYYSVSEMPVLHVAATSVATC